MNSIYVVVQPILIVQCHITRLALGLFALLMIPSLVDLAKYITKVTFMYSGIFMNSIYVVFQKILIVEYHITRLAFDIFVFSMIPSFVSWQIFVIYHKVHYKSHIYLSWHFHEIQLCGVINNLDCRKSYHKIGNRNLCAFDVCKYCALTKINF